MISVTTLLVGINTILLVIFGYLYIKKNYVIMTSEEYNTISQFVEEHSTDDEVTQERAGGCGVEVGFGADYLEDESEEDD